MIPIKIECACGQHYAFDVEPVNGCMPSPVACPGCGADGTGAANAVIAQNGGPPLPVTPPPSPRVRLAVAASPIQTNNPPGAVPTRRPDPRLGLVDRTQAEHEARAKMMWGDSFEQIVSYLMIQGFSHAEASELGKNLFKERVAAVRANGIRKIIIGCGLICLPIITLIFFLAIHMILIRILTATVMVGLYGVYLVIRGLLMAAAPKSEGGDVADQ